MKNEVVVDGDIARILLNHGYCAVIDRADLGLVSGGVRKWHAQVRRRRDGSIKDVYVTRNVYRDGKLTTEKLHRVILGLTDPATLVDHRDGDPLNNRRSNLRAATNSQNQANTSKLASSSSPFKGIKKNGSGWVARIRVDGGRKCLGTYDTPEAAARAYDAAARERFGEFALTNFKE